VCERERERERTRKIESTAGKGRERGRGIFSIAAVERKREWKRDKERGGGVRGVYSGTGSPSAVSLTKLYKAKVAADFWIRYIL